MFLDDAFRPGERAILARWKKELSLEFEVLSSTYAYACVGPSAWTRPLDGNYPYGSEEA